MEIFKRAYYLLKGRQFDGDSSGIDNVHGSRRLLYISSGCGTNNMAKKFHFFNLNGLGEPIRYILHYAGEKFEDVRYERSNWPIRNVKDVLPYGQLPLYEEGNRTLYQSLAIARYLAAKADLLPSDIWEQAVLDAIVLTIYDLFYKVLPYVREEDPVKKEHYKKEFLNETLDFYFSRFEKELEKNNGYFGRKLSWADFVLVGIVESFNLFLNVEVEKNYPAITALLNRIRSLPGIKEYIATKKPYTFHTSSDCNTNNMAKKLQYFNLNGLAESIRYILHYAGEKFEDIRYERSSWPIKNVKDSLPYGQLPLYEEGNRTLYQSLAIARYLAAKTNLLPSDLWEQALLDATVFTIYDFWNKIIAYVVQTDPAKKEQLKKEILNETVDYYFSRFEKELKNNNGFFGGKLSWADFVLVGIVESTNLFLNAEIERKYPAVVALLNKVRSLPGVKSYISTRKPYSV
ncbi:uncharacterized protein ACR2FA_006164 [Aphomia sociella]